MRDINSRGECLGPRQVQLITYTVRTFRQRSCNQNVGCLLCSMAGIYDLLDGSLDKRKVRGLVPCCGEDGYRAQVPQHTIDSYRSYIHV